MPEETESTDGSEKGHPVLGRWRSFWQHLYLPPLFLILILSGVVATIGLDVGIPPSRAIDLQRILDKAPKGEIRWNPPTKMLLHEVATVTASVNVEPLKTSASKTAVVPAPKGLTLRAALTAPEEVFKIQPTGRPLDQVIVGPSTEWAWYVTPKEPGVHELRLALILVRRGADPKALTEIAQSVTVDQTRLQQVARIAGPWKWLLLILIPYVLKAIFGRGEKKPEEPDGGFAD